MHEILHDLVSFCNWSENVCRSCEKQLLKMSMSILAMQRIVSTCESFIPFGI